MDKTKENDGIGENINSFIQKHRKPIYISAAVVLLLLILCIAAFSLLDVFRGKAVSAAEELSARYEALHDSINEDYSAVDVANLLDDLEKFAKKNSGYSGSRAWTLIAKIHSDRKEWPEAETSWIAAAEAAGKTYLAPVAWFNAAAAAEEQDKVEEAITYYSSSISSPSGFPSASRAQFAIGRLRESLNQNDEAITAYRAVITGWPHDTIWSNLAHSRIIALETKEEL